MSRGPRNKPYRETQPGPSTNPDLVLDYDLETGTLDLQARTLSKCASKLYKIQPHIQRKAQRSDDRNRRGKKFPKLKKEYAENVEEIQQCLEKIQNTGIQSLPLPVERRDRDEFKRSLSAPMQKRRCTECTNKDERIRQLQDRVPKEDFENMRRKYEDEKRKCKIESEEKDIALTRLASLKDLQRDLEEMRTKCEDTSRRYEQEKGKHEDAIKKVRGLEQQLKDNRRDLEEQPIKRTQAQRYDKQPEKEILRQRSEDKSVSTLQALKTQYDELHRRYEAGKEENERLQKNLQDLGATHVSREELARARKDLELEKTKNDQERKELIQKQQRVLEAARHRSEDNSASTLHASKTQYDELQRKYDAEKAKAERLQKSLQQLGITHVSREEFERVLKDLELEKTRNDQERKELVQKQQRELDLARNRNSDSNEQWDKLRSECGELEKKYNEEKIKYDNEKADKMDLLNKMANITKTHVPKQQLDNMRKAFEDAQKRNEEERRKTDQERNDKNKALKSLEREIKECQKERKDKENAILKNEQLLATHVPRHHWESMRSKYEEERKKYEQERVRCEHERKEKDDALTRLSAVASSKLRDNNPNITDLSDQNRPTKISEKMSELYDNEWTDAFDELEAKMNEGEVVQNLLTILLEIFKGCKELAGGDNFFERVQKCIELPNTVQSPTLPTKVVLPDQLRQQIKEFRKLRALSMLPELEKIILPKINIPCRESVPMKKYSNKCLEICWLSVVQDPPLAFAKSVTPGDKFDTTQYRKYKVGGPFVEFLVWPALHLHEDGPLLCTGVAQGCKIQSLAVPVERTDKDTSLSAVASSNQQDSNLIIKYQLSDQNRPTKIGQKLSELYDNEWADAFDELEKQMNGREVIQALLSILLKVFNACGELSTTSFFERVQRSIELPELVTPKTTCTVVLPDQLKQQIKEFRKLRAPDVLDDLEDVIASRKEMPRHDTEAMRKYLKGCVEVSWLSVVQDPPLVLNANVGERFDGSMFRNYSSRVEQYVKFVVWPALHLHADGPLLTKGIAQGCKEPPGYMYGERDDGQVHGRTDNIDDAR